MLNSGLLHSLCVQVQRVIRLELGPPSIHRYHQTGTTSPNVHDLMSPERRPQELVEGIFDHLRDDKRALKVCSLVCKAWLYPAYRRLFYETHLNGDGLATLFDSDPPSESTVAPFTRRLCIGRWRPHEWNNTFLSLDGFHSVTSLSIETLRWHEFFPEIRSAFPNRFIAIVRLELHVVATTAFSDIAEIICSFPCLEKLILGATMWQISDKPSPLLRLPRHLHALELDRSKFNAILTWLTSFGQHLTLRHVSLLNIDQPHYPIINTSLRLLGPSLESFRMHYNALDFPLHLLQYNTHLRFLHLGLWHAPVPETRLAPSLSQVNSVHIEEISLCPFPR